MAVNLPGQPGRRGAIPLLDELNLDLSYVVAPPEPDATGELVVIHYTGSLSGAPPQVAGLPLSTRSNVSGIIQFDVARGIVVAGESRAATSIALRLGGIAIETTLNAGTSLRLRPLAR